MEEILARRIVIENRASNVANINEYLSNEIHGSDHGGGLKLQSKASR